MKKLSIVCLLFFFMTGCSDSKKDNSKESSSSLPSVSQAKESTSKVKNQEQTSLTTNTSETTENTRVTEKKEATTPEVLRGTWIGNNGEQSIEFTISDDTISTDSQTYTVTNYTQEGNMYAINWDINSVSNPGNPQPFIYTYSPDTDEITSSITFHRK